MIPPLAFVETALIRCHVFLRAAWDDEAEVWYVEQCDIPGLATEADTIEALMQLSGTSSLIRLRVWKTSRSTSRST
jgi:hypothetical protein